MMNFLTTMLVVMVGVYMHAEQQLVVIKKPGDIVRLFDLNPSQIMERTQWYCAEAKCAIDAVIAIPHEQRTFGNTIAKLDRIVSFSEFSIFTNIVQILSMVHPDSAMRTAASAAEIIIGAFRVDHMSMNVSLYQAIKAYAEGNALQEHLSQDQWYYLNNLLKGFRTSGLDLPDAQRAQVASLHKEIEALGIAFHNNVASDATKIMVTREGLRGLSEDFIQALQRTDEGLYILGTDYPTQTAIMENCAVEETRKVFYRAFNNRAYPVNESILQDVLDKRHQLAQLLGFETFAHLDLNECMAKDPETVEAFLRNLLEKACAKEAIEFEIMTQESPASVTLTPEKTMQPWDVAYVHAYYKKQHFALDEQVIAEYFPQESVMQGLFDIYETFFNLKFQEVVVQGLWHEEVRCIEVYARANMQLLGYLLLDLHPRADKYNHACEATIIPSIVEPDGTQPPALALVIANFPRATATQPALWHRTQAVATFFHEFGHALHDLLGRTSLAATAGTAVKMDFVELPSQMLEYWLNDYAIIKNLSKHYKTGEQLPDAVAEKIKDVERCNSGYFVRRQIIFSLLSLLYHQKKGTSLYDTMAELRTSIETNLAFDHENHFYASFGHLLGYRSRYYGYLWARVFAQDLFAEIERHGLLNQEIGARYVQEILSKGGSKDPYELLRAFLGREPNHDAFLTSLGFTDAPAQEDVLEKEIVGTQLGHI